MTLERPGATTALLLLAVAVGAGLRLAFLTEVPPGVNQDEAVNGYDAYSLFMTGRDHHGHPFPFASVEAFGDWPPALLTFLTAPAVGIFGMRVEVLRAVTVTAGLLAIPLVYLLGCALFGRPAIGLAAAWLLSLSPWHVHLTRWAVPPALVPTLLALAALLLVLSVQRRSGSLVVWTALAAGLAVNTYPTMKLYVPLLGLVALLIYRRDILRLKKVCLAYAAVVFVVLAGPVLRLASKFSSVFSILLLGTFPQVVVGEMLRAGRTSCLCILERANRSQGRDAKPRALRLVCLWQTRSGQPGCRRVRDDR